MYETMVLFISFIHIDIILCKYAGISLNLQFPFQGALIKWLQMIGCQQIQLGKIWREVLIAELMITTKLVPFG